MIIVLVAGGNYKMVEYYVEPAGGDGNLGTAPGAGNAWLTVEHAHEAGLLVAGDNVWVRRTHNEVPGSDILCAYSGAANNPIETFGWPRDEATGTATFTNGSTAVTVVSIAADREKHAARRIKCDTDGKWYLITRVVDANTFTIDREYAGTTAAAANFTIQKDDDFDTRPVAGQAPWDGDADDLPIIDFNDAAFQLFLDGSLFHVFKSFELKDSGDIRGIMQTDRNGICSFIGCLFKQTAANMPGIYPAAGGVYIERSIIEGSGAGASQKGVYTGSDGFIHLKESAIYNCGDVGIRSQGNCFIEETNIGVEIANADYDIECKHDGVAWGRDVKLGGTNGYAILLTGVAYTPIEFIRFENYQKILGAHKRWFYGGTIEKLAADGGGTRPNQRAGGNANVIEITPDVANYEFMQEWAIEVFSHEYEVNAATRTWRYYVQNDACGALSATNLWLKLEYIEQYDDTSEYIITEVLSDETVANRANNNDWTQYIEVPTITPATASKVRITCFVSKHSAAGHIYIDPKVNNP